MKSPIKIDCICEFTCHTTLTLDAKPHEGEAVRGLRIWDETDKQGTDMVIPEEIAAALEKAIAKWQKKQVK